MSTEPTFVLWLCGPPGVGKSTVAWEIWSELAAAGVAAAHVDTDQLGMSVPYPDGDPERYRIKSANLAAIVPIYREAGARCVIVSGGIDPARADRYAAAVPDATVVLCRLRLDDPVELRERLVARGWTAEMIDDAMAEDAALDRNDVGDVCVEVAGRSVADVVRLVIEATGRWALPAGRPPAPVETRASNAPGTVLWLCGATAVGKSTVGWEVYVRRWRDGRRVAFVDLQQIGFLAPAPAGDPDNHALKARNLAAMWEAFRDDGAECLVVGGSVERAADIDRYRRCLPAAEITVIRLHAGPEQLAERVGRRGAGEGPQLAGERLTGQSAAVLWQVADDAAAEAERLAAAGIGDAAVETDGRTVADIATEAMRLQVERFA